MQKYQIIGSNIYYQSNYKNNDITKSFDSKVKY